jgi:hypothetical protein
LSAILIFSLNVSQFILPRAWPLGWGLWQRHQALPLDLADQRKRLA